MPVAKERLEILQVCKLLQCCREDDRGAITKLCGNGVPYLINYNEPEEGETALSIAAQRNNEELLDHLIDLYAHKDVVDFKGRAAIMKAAELGNVECFERLAKCGANMKLRDIEGKGVIWYLTSNTQRHARILDIAIQYGADVNNKSKDGKPVFVEACEQAMDNEQLCLALLAKGAESNSVFELKGFTALMAACKAGSAKVTAAILAAGGDPDSLDKWNTHAAHFASKAGSLGCLSALAAYGANFDQYDLKNKMEGSMGGNNPLHFAAGKGHGMCCRFLVQRGCNPKPKNNEGNVAKGIAKDGGFKEALKECKKGEKIFGKTGKNNEPWAIRLYDWTFARHDALIDQFKKFDPDASGSVSKEDFLDILQTLHAPLPEDDVKKLLMAHEKTKDSGVDYNDFLSGKKYVNKLYLMSSFEAKKKKKKGGKGGKKKGKTKIPLPIAMREEGPRTEGGNPPDEFVPRHIHFTDKTRFDRDQPPVHPLHDDSAWYLQHPDKTFMSMSDAAKSGDFDTMRMTLEKGTPVDVRDRYYKTPLMTACHQGNMDVAAFLLENGADINARDNFKWTPLHHACHSGQLDIVELLLKSGAELDSPALSGGTPLMRAIEASNIDVVTYLIERGAKLQIENKKGQTPMDVAGAYADPRVYLAVKAKWDTLPVSSDKKKGGKGSPKAKRPTTGASTSKDSLTPNAKAENQPLTPKPPPRTPPQGDALNTPMPDDAAARVRKGSILRAASALAGGIEEREDITYIPLRGWTKQPNTEELMCLRQANRERFGWQIDFPEDFKMPFLANVHQKVEIMEAEDD